MSRRNNLSEPIDGQIKLKCPYKHELAAILVRPRHSVGRQTFHRLGAVMSAPKITKLPNDELELPPPEPVDVVGIVEPGLPVVAECQRCSQTWQTPWVMIEPAIAQLADTPVVTITLADKPLC
jgi:hypothetical protein